MATHDNPKNQGTVLGIELEAVTPGATKPDSNITAGMPARFVAVVNGKVVDGAPGNFLNANWLVSSNVRPYAGVDYTYERGVTSIANIKSYPLSTFFAFSENQQWQISFQISLSGQVVSPSISNFSASKTFFLRAPGYLPGIGIAAYGTTVDTYTDPATKRIDIGMSNAAGVRGIILQLDFESWSETNGSLFCFNFVKTEVWKEAPTGSQREITANTKGEYWYDGNQLPYFNHTTPVTAKGKASHFFHDNPGLSFKLRDDRKDGKEDEDITFGYSADFRTYFFYQDSSNQAQPVLLTYPIQWGLTFKLRFNGVKFQVLNSSIMPLGVYQNMLLPEWPRNIVTGSHPQRAVPATIPQAKTLVANSAVAAAPKT